MRRSGLLSAFATPKMLDMLGSLVLGMMQPFAAVFRWLRVDRVGSWRSGRALPFFANRAGSSHDEHSASEMSFHLR